MFGDGCTEIIYVLKDLHLNKNKQYPSCCAIIELFLSYSVLLGLLRGGEMPDLLCTL